MNFIDPSGEFAEAIALGGAAIGTGMAAAIGGVITGAAAAAICYASPECRKQVSCFAQWLADIARCTKKAAEKVCREPETVDTGFLKCKEGADRRYRICTRGGHLTPLPGRGW